MNNAYCAKKLRLFTQVHEALHTYECTTFDDKTGTQMRVSPVNVPREGGVTRLKFSPTCEP